jgi:hypothetical protein
MGFTRPDLLAVDPDTFLQNPLMERMRILGADWAENGFGSTKMVHTIYIEAGPSTPSTPTSQTRA